MQAWLHPRYGLIDCSKGMSGESLWLMTVRARSGSSVVAMLSGSASRYQPSSTASSFCRSKRPGGLESAPLPVNECRPVIVRRMVATVYTYRSLVKPAAAVKKFCRDRHLVGLIQMTSHSSFDIIAFNFAELKSWQS